MNTDTHIDDSLSKNVERTLEKPSIYDYLDYRQFLKAAYMNKKSANPAYSESAFIQAAGFGKNSRGYFGLLMKGKRNLTAKTIYGFSKALKLSPKETMYFENLVFFNQAKSEEEKTFYFQRLQVSAIGENSEPLQILESQYRYVTQWSLIALREVVNLVGFKEDNQWIAKKFKGRMTAEEAGKGIQDLQNLGLITRNKDGKLVTSEPIVRFNSDENNFKNSTQLHARFTDFAKEALINDPYEKRGAQLITLCCSQKNFEKLRTDMEEFVSTTLSKYANEKNDDPDAVMQLGMQLIQLTE